MSQNKNERIWKINGLELELDLEDADVFEKTMKTFEQMDEDGRNIDKTGKMPEFIKRYCEIYYNAFDRIFGEGTGEKIFSGKKNMAKGIKVDKTEATAKIDVNIIVEYGSRIPDVAFEIQNRVKKAVENMTGLKVLEVNVHVQGVNIEKTEEN